MSLPRSVPVVLFCLLPIPMAPVATIAAQDGQKHDLKFRAEKGFKTWYRIATTQETAIQIMGQDMNQQMELVHEVELEITSVAADGAAEFEIRYLSARGSLELPMVGLVEFDTREDDDAEDDNPMSSQVRRGLTQWVGKCARGKLDAKGRLVAMPGLAEGVAKAAGQGGMGRTMTAQFTDAASLQRQVGELFARLPENPIAIGGSFGAEETHAIGGGTRMTTVATGKLDKIDGDVAVLTFKGTITAAAPSETPDAADDGDPAARMRRSMRVENGKFEGEERIDRKTGWKVGSKSKSTMAMSMASPMGGEERMQMSSTTTSNVERLPAKPAGAKAAPAPAPATGADKSTDKAPAKSSGDGR